MPKDAAFWQFLYVLFTKIHDERSALRGIPARSYAGLHEPFTADGQRDIAARIRGLFDDVKSTYPLFTVRDELSMSDRALAFLVGELAPTTSQHGNRREGPRLPGASKRLLETPRTPG